jgi:hypothetical protein
MGLDVFLDCACVARGLVQVPDRWSEQVQRNGGRPELRESEYATTEEWLGICRWYRASCVHQRAVNKLGSRRMNIVNDLARNSGSPRLETLGSLFCAPDGVYSPAQASLILDEVEALSHLNPSVPPRGRLHEPETGRTVLWNIGFGCYILSAHGVSPDVRYDVRFGPDDLSVKRVHFTPEGLYLREELVFRSLQFGVSTRPSGGGKELWRWRDTATPQKVTHDLELRVSLDNEDDQLGQPVQSARWEPASPPFDLVTAPLRVACQGSVESGNPLTYSR